MKRTLAFLLLAGFAAPAQLPPALEFEVASIKAAPPPDGRPIVLTCNGGPGTKDPGLFTCRNITLWNLVTMAYGMRYEQVSGPDWMRSAPFNVDARVPDGTTSAQFRTMMQNLLADRFKLLAHHESRDVQKYDLVIAKGGPRFREVDAAANPTASSPFKLDENGFPVLLPGEDGLKQSNGRSRMYRRQYTMDSLTALVSSQVGTTVTDATGLKGKYAIGLSWVTDRLAAEDPGAGPAIAQALQNQLGLRLESKKGPVDFLVVDHTEKVPSDN